MNRPFVLSLLLVVVCAFVFADGGRADKKQPNIEQFKERFRLERLRRDLPQIRNFSDSVQAFQIALAQAYNYLPGRQPYLRIRTVLYYEPPKYYPSIYEFKDIFTEESNVYVENLENKCPANASNKLVCTKTLSPLMKVKLLNSTEIYEFLKFDPKVTARSMSGICSLVLFYAKECPYSILGVPHYLFLHRMFPHIRMVAVDTVSEQRFNLVFDIIGTPTLILFHNGIPAAKFDKPSFTVYELTKFIVKWTDLLPSQLAELTETDLKSLVEPAEINYTLLFSWLVFIFWAIYYKWHLNMKRFLRNIKNFFLELIGLRRPHAD